MQSWNAGYRLVPSPCSLSKKNFAVTCARDHLMTGKPKSSAVRDQDLGEACSSSCCNNYNSL